MVYQMLSLGIEQCTKVVWSNKSHFLLTNWKNKVHIRRFSYEGGAKFNFQPRRQGGGGSLSVWGVLQQLAQGLLLSMRVN